MSDFTQLLAAAEGDPQTASQILPLVYDQLRHLAAAKLARESPGQTLDATALVHEAYLRLVGPPAATGATPAFANHRHFFAAAAEAMRRILIDRARHKQTLKAGGKLHRQVMDESALAEPDPDFDLMALDEALSKLEKTQPRQAELVKLRFFAGLTIDQAAQALGVSTTTAENDWAYARCWLRLEIGDPAS